MNRLPLRNGGGPLDPARLLEGIAAVAGPAPMAPDTMPPPAPGDRPSRAAARQMNAELRIAVGHIFANWLVRVTNLPHLRARPDLRLSDVKAGMPELVIAAIDALAAHDPIVRPEPNAAAAAAAVTLARARAAHVFSLGDVLAELQELRSEFFAAVWRINDAAPALAPRNAAPRDLMERFVGLGGALLIAVSEDWVAHLGAPAPVAAAPEERL